MKNIAKQIALAAGLALVVAGCSDDNGETARSADGAEAAMDQTLAEALLADPSLSIAAGEFERTGLIGALDAEASTTIFVPTNAAFEALGEEGRTLLSDPQYGAIVAAVLRNHMVPGVLDVAAIDQAIADAGGEAAVANLGGGVLTLARGGGGRIVREGSGRQAAFGDKTVLVGNGAIIPIDTVLVDPATLLAPAE
ncbi:MAG: fasciclin domain-containing protein [Erythrobacter sp.]